MRIVILRIGKEIVNISMENVKSIKERHEQSKRINRYRKFLTKNIFNN